ncbi:MAG: hypothetical protein J6J86_05750, partial [Lachnospiraceae bacterium]|nr:hypothetical protein [Lachnospiraceae bacterium]
TSTTEVLGKPVLSDEKNQKVTYVTLEGLERSAAYVDSISREALKELKELGKELREASKDAEEESLFLEELLVWLINREK